MPGRDEAEAQRQVVQWADSYLSHLASRLDTSQPAEIGIYYGQPVRGIVDEVYLRGADLVVMCTHGRSGLSRLILGSVADGVMRHSPVPVLLVPAACDHEWTDVALGQPGRPLRVLVPLDGSRHAETALAPVRALVADTRTKVTLLGAVEPRPTVPYATELDIHEDDAEWKLQAMRAYLEGQCVQLGPHADARAAVTLGSPAGAIAEDAHERGFDLVVMATHGRGGLSRVVLGSVAAGVLHQLHVPLLLLRPTIAVGAAEPAEAAQAAARARAYAVSGQLAGSAV